MMRPCLPGDSLWRSVGIRFVFLIMVLSTPGLLMAQCPPNIDFENGNFSGWTLYTGDVSTSGTQNLINLTQTPGPVPNRHQMLSITPGDGLDQYGHFPKNSPNGSAHSVKLGNDNVGSEAEGMSYDFTIPANLSKFSIVYYYAAVIQDPGHLEYQQPRLEVEVKDLTDNKIIDCSSIEFVVSGETPGFMLSDYPSSNAPVWYKPWAANTINLNGYQGKTIRLFFKTADCTYISHFGYAYIDVSTECGNSFSGTAFCPQDTALNITAPFGYNGYTWYNDNFTQILGTGHTLHLSPPPPSGTIIKVKLSPFGGYGCVDTLAATLIDTLSVVAVAGPDKVACNNNVVQIGSAPLDGLVYNWSPAAGLSNTGIANPFATVSGSRNYILTVRTSGGGCISTDTVLVRSEIVDSITRVIGPESYCSASGQSTVLKVYAADSIQWYKDGIAVIAATHASYQVTASGVYYAILFTNSGCTLVTQKKTINIYPSPVAGFKVNNPVQCFLDNRFIFTDTSKVASGLLQYSWDMGNGKTFSTKDVEYSFEKAGQYLVKLVVKATGDCIDSRSMTISVLPNAIADFSTRPVCVNLQVPLMNNTVYTGTYPVNYLWDFGNGDISNLADPVYHYNAIGTYTIRLTVNTAECTRLTTKEQIIVIDEPQPGTRYTDQSAIFNFPLQLEARHIGNQALWAPATNLDFNNIYNPEFKGITQQLYTIRLTTQTGCVTIDTQLVKTIKKIKIYVPTVFTPGGDGKNDLLRPLLYGFKKVNYFRIYNRWGKLFFQMKSDRPGWDGKVDNIPQEMQTVVWILEAEDVDGNMHQAKGTTLLMR